MSATLGSDQSGDGSKASAYASVGKALEAGARRLYLCGESFDEALELPAGVTVFGALRCSDTSWVYDGSARTRIEPSAETLDAVGTSIAVRLGAGSGASGLYDVDVTAPDGNEPGESSIAVLAEGVTVSLVRCELTAGVPVGGDDGESLANDEGLNGVAGTAGNAALGAGTCNATANPGGAGGQKSCGGTVVDGGMGGGAFTNPGGNGLEGQPATDGEPTGDGGAGQSLGPTPPVASCATGEEGADGTPGDAGAGATGIGTLTAAGIGPAAATAGGAGGPGQGGGGGGASACTSGATGPSGGGGGSGGCGGLGGGAGGAGGSSVALVSLEASVTLTSCSLVAAAGAPGGGGGTGQQGGGGLGGGPAGGAYACGGGQGGNGGNGGHGGGGVGGHSLAVAYEGTVPTMTDTALNAAEPGAGGEGAEVALDGSAGLGCEVLEFGGGATECAAI